MPLVQREAIVLEVIRHEVTKPFLSEVGIYQEEKVFATFLMVRSVAPTCVSVSDSYIWEQVPALI